MGLCKKKKALSREDFEQQYGRHWIWTALDPESKLLISFFIGQRTLEDCKLFIEDLAGRIKTRPLFTSDELAHYQTTLAGQFSTFEEQAKTGKRGRPRVARQVVDPELMYATVHKTRENGKVVKVTRNIVFGDTEKVSKILDSSPVSKTINTAFVERSNLTLRNHSKNLTRKTICFAKRREGLHAQLCIVATYYNFSKPHSGLTLNTVGKKIRRTPAMAAKIIDRVWLLDEILAHPMT